MADHMWKAACRVLELEELVTDPKLATPAGRLEHRERVVAAFAEAIARYTTAEVVDLLQSVTVPVAPVNSVPEALADAQIEERGLVVEGGGVRMLANPIKMTDLEQGPYERGPHLGEHTRALLIEAGVSSADTDALLSES